MEVLQPKSAILNGKCFKLCYLHDLTFIFNEFRIIINEKVKNEPKRQLSIIYMRILKCSCKVKLKASSFWCIFLKKSMNKRDLLKVYGKCQLWKIVYRFLFLQQNQLIYYYSFPWASIDFFIVLSYSFLVMIKMIVSCNWLNLELIKYISYPDVVN